VSFYGPSGLEVIERDGEPVPVSAATEAGWFAYGVEDEIGSGETVVYHLEFLLPPVGGHDDPVEWCQPPATRSC
jgi:hypothetical protein